jgi:hypothetical protein
MLKRGLLVFWWFPLAAIILINNLVILSRSNSQTQSNNIIINSPVTSQVQLLSDRGTGKILGASIEAGDGRLDLLNKFMQDSPMLPYAQLIITEADKYHMDYRIVPAIAMCESNLGKHIPSSDSYNAWGIAVYTGQQNGAKFANWEQAIIWVNKYLFNKFIGQKIVDVKDIGAIWAPPSVEKGHSWANCVESFIRKIQ